MLPILISSGAKPLLIIEILAIKVIIGLGVGLIIDLVSQKTKGKNHHEEIHEMCEHEHCHCEEDGIIKSSIKHTIQIFTYIFVITLALNIIIHGIGEDRIASIMVDIPFVGPLIASIIGIIPNCASSVILTELYLENIITVGAMIAGLLVNSGVGLLVLFKVNKNQKENLGLLGILYIVGVISGIILDLFI